MNHTGKRDTKHGPTHNEWERSAKNEEKAPGPARPAHHLIHLALQGHGTVLDPLLLRHLIVEHALQLLKSPGARLQSHLGRV